MNRRKSMIVSVSFFFMAILLLVILDSETQLEQQPSAALPVVSVVEVATQDNRGFIEVSSTVEPRWNTFLKAQVNGEIIALSQQALAGSAVKKGEVLLEIENSNYVANVDETKHILAEAELHLLQQQMKYNQAHVDWQRSGIVEAPSNLSLNKPQLALAETVVDAARSRLLAAQKQLDDTYVKAPFDGFVTARQVSIGQSVSEGETLLQLIDQYHLDIHVTLNQQQWQMLVEDWSQNPAKIFDLDGTQIGQAMILRGGDYIDLDSRQYNLYLQVSTVAPNRIRIGDFVLLKLPGRIAANSLALPESALTRDGYIWYLDGDDRLRRFFAEVLFHRNNQIIVAAPKLANVHRQHPSHWRIAITPLAAFLAGTQVSPLDATEI